jgi:4-hydroxybenzoate polyprenyltransferase
MQASFFAILLAIMAVALVFIVPGTNALPLISILLVYWLMNIAYSFKLKQYGIIDIFCIAIGFVLRVLIGGQVTGIWISQWIVLLTFLLALFLALTKRYDDCSIFEATGNRPRKSITTYNKEFITTSTSIIAAITSVCYIMYTLSETVIERTGSQYLYLTSVWVLAGLLRYVQNMIVYKRSKSPTNLLIKDSFLHLCILGWIVSFIIIIYV